MLTIKGTGGGNRLNGRSSTDFIYAKGGNDKVYSGSGDDYVYGGSGNDMLDGQKGDDYLSGESGSDTLKGGTGDDILSGGTGADKLFGDSGDDLLFGMDGNDTLLGGAGNDTYYYSSNTQMDLIADDSGNDTLRFISKALADVGTWVAQDTNLDGNVDMLIIQVSDTETVQVANYFDNSTNDVNSLAAGGGALETIQLTDTSLSFADVVALLS